MELDYFFFRGTLAPDFRASDSPMAIACFRLVTFLPERPLLSVPLFLRCIADLTFLPAALPYLAITLSPSIQFAQLFLRGFQPLTPLLRKSSSRTIDIETDHRHRRPK
jgi:hypothetical protein